MLQMKKLMALLLILCLCAGLVPALAEEPAANAGVVTKVTLNMKTFKPTFVDGDTLKVTLEATVTARDGSSQKVNWTTSNESVAKVKPRGNKVDVTVLKAGTATITATARDGSGKKAVCKITAKTINGPSYYKKYLKKHMDQIGSALGSLVSGSDGSGMKNIFDTAQKYYKKLEESNNKLPKLYNDKTLKNALKTMKKNIEEGGKRAEEVADQDSKIMKYQQNAMKALKKYTDRVKKLLNVK